MQEGVMEEHVRGTCEKKGRARREKKLIKKKNLKERLGRWWEKNHNVLLIVLAFEKIADVLAR